MALVMHWYRAIDEQHRIVRGRLAAHHSADLEQRLHRHGLLLIRCGTGQSILDRLRASSLQQNDLITLCTELSQLMTAGVPLLDGLRLLRDQAGPARTRDVFTHLIAAIEGGDRFSDACATRPDVFSPLLITLIEAGESSGTVPQSLQQVADLLQRAAQQRAALQQQLFYPTIVTVITIAVGVLMLTTVVPQLTRFLEQLGLPLPLHTRVLIVASSLLQQYAWVGLIGLAALVGTNAVTTRMIPAFALLQERLLLRLPMIGTALTQRPRARVAHTLAVLYDAGIPLVDALSHTPNLVSHRSLQLALHNIRTAIVSGQTFVQACAAEQFFSPIALSMLRVGEQTGALSNALRHVHRTYTAQADRLLERLHRLIEPTLTLLLGGLLGWITLAVLDPIYNALSQLRIE